VAAFRSQVKEKGCASNSILECEGFIRGAVPHIAYYSLPLMIFNVIKLPLNCCCWSVHAGAV